MELGSVGLIAVYQILTPLFKQIPKSIGSRYQWKVNRATSPAVIALIYEDDTTMLEAV